MANIVIDLRGGDEIPAKKNLEVYKDVSAVGKKMASLPETGKSGYFVDKLVNVKAVQNSIHQIFTWIPGERVLNPEFGCRLHELLYEGIVDHNIEAIMAEIRHCFTAWEPRAELQNIVNVRDINDTENNTVKLDVYYTIKGLDDEQYRYSYVYGGGN